MGKEEMRVWFGPKPTKKGRREQRHSVVTKFLLPKIRRKGNG